MTPEDIKAIHESIMHWNDICMGCEDDYKGRKCALCRMYPDDCFDCPLRKSGYKCETHGSPWDNYSHIVEYYRFCTVKSAEEAETMLITLINLLPESERTIYGE